MRFRMLAAVVSLMTCVVSNIQSAEPCKVFELWPGTAPGDKGNTGEEKDMTKSSDGLVGGKALIRLGNVTKPTLSVYRPPSEKDTGAAVMVCPGGGYHILAMDREGTEVCDWLNSIGVTGLLLKYRVPKREGLDKHTAALQDAQRALGIARHRAGELGLDPKRIGVLGFSAGGHLAAAVSNNWQQRSYVPVDDADAVSCRPDFAVLIYPAYLTVKEEQEGEGGSCLAPVSHHGFRSFIATTMARFRARKSTLPISL